MKFLTPFIFVCTLLCSQLANATLVRVSDGTTLNDLSTESSLVWDIGEGLFDGKLLGAFNVNVNGTLWDVVFRDGTFSDIFGDASGLDAHTVTEAHDFSMALLNDVFIDSGAFLFDTMPKLIAGCTSDVICMAHTPFKLTQLMQSVRVTGIFAQNMPLDVEHVATDGSYDVNEDLHSYLGEVYADWSLAPPARSDREVPAPSAVLFLLFGLAGIVLKRRKTLR